MSDTTNTKENTDKTEVIEDTSSLTWNDDEDFGAIMKYSTGGSIFAKVQTQF